LITERLSDSRAERWNQYLVFSAADATFGFARDGSIHPETLELDERISTCLIPEQSAGISI
jgi:hypothetical protein